MATLQADLAAALLRITKLEADLAAIPPPPAPDTSYWEPVDTIWMLICGYLVWMMSSGFCFLEMGSVRVKHSQNILAKNILVPVVAFLCWYVTGYALAFGPRSSTEGYTSKFIGGTWFCLHGFMDNKMLFRGWFFQGAFCDTSASILSGGVAERISMFGFMTHTIALTAFIYPVAVFWCWSGYGWLNYVDPADGVQKSTVGPWYQDWAGSGVIHYLGGTAALVGAIIVGPRKGRFDPDSDPAEWQPHSVAFTVLGTFILWFGWYGFNPGCVANIHDPLNAYRAAIAVANTTLAPCSAGVVAWLMRKYLVPPYSYDVPALCNGVLAGLVAVTAGAGFVKQWEAVIIGAIGGALYCFGSWLFPKLKIDDPIDALSVHFINGGWGTVAVGFFGNPAEGLQGNGCFYTNPATGKPGNQIGVQFLALLVFFCWSAVLSAAVLLPLRLAGWLRWSDEIQDAGANEIQHSPHKDYASTRPASPPKEYLKDEPAASPGPVTTTKDYTV